MLTRLSKSAITLLSGTVVGQIVVLIASPLLTRLFTPIEFGQFSVYVVILYFFMAASALRYDAAITVAASTRDANSLARLAIVIVGTTSTLSFFGIKIISGSVESELIHSIQTLLPLSIAIAGINTILINIQLRRHKQKMVATGRAGQAAASSLSQISYGYLSSGTKGLIIGQMIGIVTSILCLASPRNLITLTSWSPRRFKGETKRVIKKYKAFPKFELSSALAIVANSHLPTMILGAMYGASAAGAYALAQRIIATPLGIIANSIASTTLAFGRVKSNDKDATIVSAIESIGDIVHSTIVLVGVFLIFFFDILFGVEWKSAGIIAGWVCLSAGAKFKFDSLFALTTTSNRQREGLLIQLQVISLKVLPLIAVAPLAGANFAVMLLSFISCIIQFLGCRKITAAIPRAQIQDTSKFAVQLILGTLLLSFATYNYQLGLYLLVPVQILIIASAIKTGYSKFRNMR